MSGRKQASQRGESGAEGLLVAARMVDLELARGCDDGAVVGGFGAGIAAWARTQAVCSPAALARRLERMAEAFTGYRHLSLEARRELCQRAARALRLYMEQYLPVSAGPTLSPDADVRLLPGVGPRRAEVLASLGVRTVRDLLWHVPVRHDDRRTIASVASLEHRQSATVEVVVTGAGRVRKLPRWTVVEVPASDGVTPITLVWFNQEYRATAYAVGTRLLVTGQVMIRQGAFSLLVAETEVLREGDPLVLSTGRLAPIYPAARGLTQPLIRRLVHAALERCQIVPGSAVPPAVAEARGLMPLADALRQLHFPGDEQALRAARVRVAYEELFILQAALACRRMAAARSQDASLAVGDVYSELCRVLPFQPTKAQERVIAQIIGDLQSRTPANRLIHGEVGSGKTVCAAAALLAAARAGKQAALMAPTEILAEQHYLTIRQWLQPLGVRCGLLTGRLSEKGRSQLRRQAETGEVSVLVGTHALFQERLVFADLRVVVIDEQHRFGVEQRSQLSGKGRQPHVFVMSATPIPRTLALTLYGDFDVSVLDQLPPGRMPPLTVVASGRERLVAYHTIAAQIVDGAQAYVVCPLVAPDDTGYVAAAEREFHRLSTGHFASFRLGLVHGRQRPDERDETMVRFRKGELDILVATTVVEVGVDVPNATVMLVENAERFGLAQLHQLRGRVARGERQGLCMLLTRASTPDVVNRLKVLERISNGFEVAEEDLRRRGPGEMVGARQSGLPGFKVANLVTDTQTLLAAREDAFAVVAADPELSAPEHIALREALVRFGQTEEGWAI